ncbi:unnamed protein product, partial [Allacma fusca]
MLRASLKLSFTLLTRNVRVRVLYIENFGSHPTVHDEMTRLETFPPLGEYYKHRVTFREVLCPARSNEDFRAKKYEDHHVGSSELEVLDFDIVQTIPCEYLHLVCLGVVKKLIRLWLRGSIQYIRLPGNEVDAISQKLKQMKKFITKEFQRKPREILCSFYESAQLYGKEYMSLNVHNLSHLASYANHLGPLDQFAAFKYENYLGFLKSHLRNNSNTLQQLHRRLHERYLIKRLPEDSNQDHYAISGKCHQDFDFPNNNRFKILRIQNTEFRGSQPNNLKKFKRVKSRQIPGENWEESPCRVLNSYDNYDFARKYALPQSVYTSELSDMDDVVSPRHAQSKFTRRMMEEHGPGNAKKGNKCNPITSIVLPTPPALPVSTLISSDISESDPVGQLDTHCPVSFPESQSYSYDNMFSQRSCIGL